MAKIHPLQKLINKPYAKLVYNLTDFNSRCSLSIISKSVLLSSPVCPIYLYINPVESESGLS